MSTQAKIIPHIRWMIRRDMDAVLAIESDCFQFPWDEDAFIRCLRQRNCIGMVAEDGDRVVGYMVYELHKHKLHLLNFAVAWSHRGKGVGAAMVANLVSKLNRQRRTRMVTEVRETNLDALLFFRSQGFEATELLRDYYDDTDEDAIVMVRRCDKAVEKREAVK